MAPDLHPNEHVIFDGHPSWRGTLSFYVRGILLAAVGAGIAALVTVIGSGFSWGATIGAFAALVVIVLLVGFVYRMTTTYTITNQRMTIRRGILSRHVQETRVERVQNVNTNQTLVDRLLRVGAVDFDTAGSDDSDFTFRGVANPARVVRAVDEAHRQREQSLPPSVGGL
ncbi:MAG TPA: PH domain-containing protein [Conexibacter sp.]|nr:PH domain-containing protein [Conexibacter sp.]